MVSYLEQQGCICQVANNGVEALEKWVLFHFGAILMDIEMPFMRGFEATKHIREREKLKFPQIVRTPIVGLSGYSRKEFEEQSLKIGMDAFLSKPYKREELYTLLMQFL